MAVCSGLKAKGQRRKDLNKVNSNICCGLTGLFQSQVEETTPEMEQKEKEADTAT